MHILSFFGEYWTGEEWTEDKKEAKYYSDETLPEIFEYKFEHLPNSEPVLLRLKRILDYYEYIDEDDLLSEDLIIVTD
ncbi:MAG TPA: hypothetical protein PLK59_00080 [Synergistales bacterium]|nr:hypothetical protein [Synergistales bacterium]